MKPRLLLPVLFSSLLLAGCVKEPAGFQIDGGDHSLTIERNKPFAWSNGWELDLIVTRFPDCQRRHPLKKASDARKLRIDLYRTASGAFILNQGNRWYVADTRECRMQQFDEEPPEPGDYIGSFKEKGSVFGYFPAEEEKTGKAAAK